MGGHRAAVLGPRSDRRLRSALPRRVLEVPAGWELRSDIVWNFQNVSYPVTGYAQISQAIHAMARQREDLVYRPDLDRKHAYERLYPLYRTLTDPNGSTAKVMRQLRELHEPRRLGRSLPRMRHRRSDQRDLRCRSD